MAFLSIIIPAMGCGKTKKKIIIGSSGPTAPAAPSDLTATPKSTSEIDLAWTNHATNADEFKIERSLDNITYTLIATISPTDIAYASTGLTPCTTFYYRLRAYNIAGYSLYCDPVSATTLSTFGVNGFIKHDSAAGGNGRDWGWGIITDANDKILVCGQSNNGSNDDMVIWRYSENGTPDTEFNGSGFVVSDGAAGGSGFDYAETIVIDTQGRIVAAGQSMNASGNADMVIWRYNDDGTHDSSFGIGGVVTHTNAAGGNGNDGGFGLAIDENNRILVTGASTNTAHNYDMVIWCYDVTGTLDTTFNSPKGFVVHNNAAGGNGDNCGEAIVIDANGKIVVAGHSRNAAGHNSMVIWRYNADGNPDATFGVNGVVTYTNTAGGYSDTKGFDVKIDGANKILVTGRTSGTVNAMIIWRYDEEGKPDLGFGTAGVVTHTGAAGGSGPDGGNAIMLDADGKILVTGYSTNTFSNYDMVIWRYLADGKLDTDFDTDGVVVHINAADGIGHDQGLGITIDAYGRILVTGFSLNPSVNYDMVIWRYLATGEMDKE